MAVTKEQILAVAEALEAEGVNPTQINVRDRLGGGSFSTIQPVLAERNQQKLERAAALAPMPESLLGRAKGLAEDAWHTALSIADGVLTSEREALRAATVRIEIERNDFSALADELEERVDGATRKIESLGTEIVKQNAELNELRLQLSAAKGGLEQAERQAELERNERNQLHAALMEANAQLARMRERDRRDRVE